MNIKKEIKLVPLRILEENNGHCSWATLKTFALSRYSSSKTTNSTSEKLAHSMYLFEKEDAVEKIDKGHYNQVWYKLTPWGHALIGSWHERLFHFLIYKKHNLFSFVAIVISVFTLGLTIINLILCN